MPFNRENTRDRYPCADQPEGSCPRREPGCQTRCPEMLTAQLVHLGELRERKGKEAREKDAVEYIVRVHARLGRKKLGET